MIQVNRIRIVVNTIEGTYGADVSFSKGLNVIRGDNTTGKSTLLQCMLYCFGFEQLLGDRNEKTMQSVLKDVIEDGPRKVNVLQSEVFMEIANDRGEVITINRSVKNGSRDARLVDVYTGAMNVDGTVPGDLRSMYVHDPGAARDGVYGFHAFLESFMGLALPLVRYVDGRESKLYIQTIAPASLIEQKRGWSDFLATIPYFGLRSPEKRVVEFILAMDVLETAKRKQIVLAQRQDIQVRWGALRADLTEAASRGGVEVSNLPEQPVVLTSISSINMRVLRDDENTYSLDEHIAALREDLEHVERVVKKVGERSDEYQKLLDEREERIRQVSRLHDQTSDAQALELQRFRDYERQLAVIEDDIRKNKGYLKIRDFGSQMNLALANHQCPTCHQAINDTLLPQDIKQEALGVEENILHLEAQKRMYELYMGNQRSVIQRNQKKIARAATSLSDMRGEVRRLKNALVQDDRLPSEFDIEEKVRIQARVKFYGELKDQLIDKLRSFAALSQEWLEMLEREKGLPSDYFSTKDREKLRMLNDAFKRYLMRFKYSSKSEEDIEITNDRYQPTVNGLNMKLGSQRYDIRYDSSASDFIRAIWAYTCALYVTSREFSGNHIGLMVFDEPAQHSMAIASLHELLAVLSDFTSAQCIVAASFSNKDSEYEEATDHVAFRFHHIEGKLIRKLSDQQSA